MAFSLVVYETPGSDVLFLILGYTDYVEVSDFTLEQSILLARYQTSIMAHGTFP